MAAKKPEADDTNERDQDRSAPQESAQALIARADRMISDLDASVRLGIEKTERRTIKQFNATLTALYAAVDVIEENGKTQEFLESRGVRGNGNIKNPCFLLVRAFADSACSVLQGRLCKVAAVIQLARLQDIKQAEFETWKQLWSVERACAELRRLNNRPPRKQDEVPEPKPVTRGLTGEHPALLQFSSDGSGRFKLARILSPDDLLRYAETGHRSNANNAQH